MSRSGSAADPTLGHLFPLVHKFLAGSEISKSSLDELHQALRNADLSSSAAFVQTGGLQLLTRLLKLGPTFSMAARVSAAASIRELVTNLSSELLESLLATTIASGTVTQLVELASSASESAHRRDFCRLLLALCECPTQSQKAAGALTPASLRQLVEMLTPVPRLSLGFYLAKLLLAAIQQHPPHRAALIRAGAVPAVATLLKEAWGVETLAGTPGPLDVRGPAADVLLHLAQGGAAAEVFRTGCMPQLVKQLKLSGTVPRLIGLQHLVETRKSGRGPETRDGVAAFIAHGGVEALVGILKGPASGEQIEAAGRLLAYLMFAPKGNKAGEAVVQGGGMPVLLATLGKGRAALEGTEGAISNAPDVVGIALWHLLVATRDSVPAFLASGGVQRLVDLLRVPGRRPRMQLPALYVLTLLVIPNNPMAQRMSWISLTRQALHDGVRLSAAGESAFGEVANMQGAIGLDSSLPERVEALVNVGGIGVVARLYAERRLRCAEAERLAVDILKYACGNGPEDVPRALVVGARAVVAAGWPAPLLDRVWCSRSWDQSDQEANFVVRRLAKQTDEAVQAGLRDAGAIGFLVHCMWSTDVYANFTALLDIRTTCNNLSAFYRAIDAAGVAAPLLLMAVAGHQDDRGPTILGLAELLSRPECEHSRAELRRLGALHLLERVPVPGNVPQGKAYMRAQYARCCLLLRRAEGAPVPGPSAPPPSADLREILSRERTRVADAVELCRRVSERCRANGGSAAAPAADIFGNGEEAWDRAALLAGLPRSSPAVQAALCGMLRDATVNNPGKAAAVAAIPGWAGQLLQVVQYGAPEPRRRAAGVLHNVAVGCPGARTEICAAGGVAALVERLRTRPEPEPRELRAVLGALRTLARGGGAFRQQVLDAGGVAAMLPYLRTREGTADTAGREPPPQDGHAGGVGASTVTTTAVLETLRAMAALPLAAQQILQGVPPQLAVRAGVKFSQVTALQ